VNCGAALGYTDPSGNGWFPDREYTAGSWGHVGGDIVERASIDITGTSTPQIYRTELYGASAYKFALPDGKYQVRLHFAETYAASSVRVYDVAVNGKTVLTDFDPFKAAGGQNKAYVKEWQTQVTNGNLVIKFIPQKDSTPTINGIEIMKTR